MSGRFSTLVGVAAAIAVGLVLVSGAAAGTVQVALQSDRDGKVVAPGDPIDWRIVLQLSPDNAGLAAISVDLRQAAGNPVLFDLPPADEIPPELTNFARPAGISNPPTNGGRDGFLGTPIGAAGARDLVEIGGAQNTFGVPGEEYGQAVDVVSGIGQSQPQLLAGGSFPAPAAAGVYVFNVDGALATVLEAVRPPPQFSSVSVATIAYSPAGISVRVGVIGDLNCDGALDFNDIDAFVVALLGPEQYAAAYPDCAYGLADVNGDGSVDLNDIDPFVLSLSR